MPLTKVSFSVIQVANNVTSKTVGNTTSIPSFTFDQNGVITSASNVTPSIANTQITGVFTATQIANNTITGTQISNTANITASTISAAVIPSNSFNYRNKFINGNFDFWQRATSGTPAAIWAYVSADRWGGHHDGTAGTYSRSTNVPNTLSTYSMRMTGTSGGSNAYLDQRIEASELREIIAKGSVTVSGWIRRVGGPTSTLSVNLICADATDNFSSYTTHGAVFTVNNSISGNGTASSSSLTLTSNDTWYYFSVTDTSIASRANIANGAQIYFAVGGLDSNSKYFEFSQLQIEAGPNATPFEQRSIGTELHLCQRYYSKSYIQGAFAGQASAQNGIQALNATDGNQVQGFRTPVTMRATPSVTIYSYNGAAATLSNTSEQDVGAGASSWGAYGMGDSGCRAIVGSGGLSSGVAYIYHYVASAEL